MVHYVARSSNVILTIISGFHVKLLTKIYKYVNIYQLMRVADTYDSLGRPKFLPDHPGELVRDIPTTDSMVNRLHRTWDRVPSPSRLVGIVAAFAFAAGAHSTVETYFPPEPEPVYIPFKRMPTEQPIVAEQKVVLKQK